MKPYYEHGGITIYHGDCRDVLAALEPQSVQTCVTSPPYWGLRDYGIPPSVWGGEQDCDHEWGDEQRPGNYNWADKIVAEGNLDRGHQKAVMRTRNAFCQKCGAWLGNLGLEPTPDLFVAHMVEVFEAVWRVMKDDGTLWLNLGDSYNGYYANQYATSISASNQHARPKIESGAGIRCPSLKPKDLVGIPWRVAFALQAAGWYLRSDIIWHKPNPMPESVTDRPTKSHEYIFLLSKSERYYCDADVIKEPMAFPDDSRPEDLARAFSRRRAAQPVPRQCDAAETAEYSEQKRNKRSVWTVATKPVKEAHFATFPPKLIEPCILAGCPEGGIVLDPFTGAGTTAMVARDLGRKFIGAELNPEYIEIARKRIGRQEVLF